MTLEQLKEKLLNDLRIVDQALEVQRRNIGASSRSATRQNRNGSQNDGSPYGIIGPSVVEAIKQCGKRYDVRDIRKRLLKVGKDISSTQIATALRQFE